MTDKQKLENKILELIRDSQQMTNSDIQGVLEAILLNYKIKVA